MSQYLPPQSTMPPPSTRQRHNPDSLTLLDAGGSGGRSFTLIYEFLGDSKLSLVCKGFQEVGDRAMANLTYSLLNKGLCLELRFLRNIRPLKVGSFAKPREYTTKVRQVVLGRLSKQEKLDVTSLFTARMLVERGMSKYLSSAEKMRIPPDYLVYDHIDRLILQAERLMEKQDQEDEYALLKLANELKKQIPAIPDADVRAIRAWLSDPANQTAIQAVTRIDLSFQQLKVIPPEITALVNLQVLDLEENLISEVPETMAALVNLRKLDIDGNQITEVPAVISQLVNLQVLYLGSNQISEIPETISQLVNLQGLNLGGNQIRKIPDEISQLVNLQELLLMNNQIPEIPAAIGNLVNLQVLKLGNNQISEIPAAISQLVNLEVLYLEGNQITEVPATMAAMRDRGVIRL